MKSRNVLIFPAGTEIGLEIFNALRYCKEVRLFGAGQDVSNHARLLYSTYHVIPGVHEFDWTEALANLCLKLKIDYIFPAHDDVIVALSKNRSLIPATVLCPEEQACITTRSKSATYRALAGIVGVPKLSPLDCAPETYKFPLLVKPDKGQGSLGVTRVDSYEYLPGAVRGIAEPIICEYLPGDEFTVDCFSDREQGLLFARARSRRRTRNGISVHTVTENIQEVHDIAARIAAELGLYGAWFFQMKRSSSGELKLLEVAPRIAGAMATHRVMGVNFPLLSIFEHERIPIKILINEGPMEVDRALYNRYRHDVNFGALYVDFDDTLVYRGSLNSNVVALVFEAISRQKPVTLLTRHIGNLDVALKKFHLASVFDTVVHLRAGERKSDYISGEKPILVDDSFSERLEVSDRLGIPTFDCSMVEVLLEDRCWRDTDALLSKPEDGV